MEVDIYVLICRKEGVTDRVTLEGLQGPKPLFIKTETRNLVVHHIVDVTIRDKIIIVQNLLLNVDPFYFTLG